MKHWKPVSITAAAAVLAATLGAGLPANAATPEKAARVSRTEPSVSIAGPMTVRIGASCSWQAIVSGVPEPYFDQWATLSGGWEGFRSSDMMFTHTFENLGPNFVQVRVFGQIDHDQRESTVTKSLNVMVVDANDAAECT